MPSIKKVILSILQLSSHQTIFWRECLIKQHIILTNISSGKIKYNKGQILVWNKDRLRLKVEKRVTKVISKTCEYDDSNEDYSGIIKALSRNS